jgi:hypothetical protein
MQRSAELTAFLDSLLHTLSRATGPAADLAAEAARRVQTTGIPGGQPGQGPERLPVCQHIAPALAAFGGPLAKSFAAFEHQLPWRRRASASATEQPFFDGHANAAIFGPGGPEDHPGLWIGATIMAPHVIYPNHSHPPAEVYVPLSPGEWWNSSMDWTDPGPSGFIYNPPGIQHSMRAGTAPFLALWVLPI